MNKLLEWLQEGDLRSDGLSQEVVQFVLKHPDLVDDLVLGLSVENAVIRGRAADAIEHLARDIPERLLPHQNLIARSLIADPIPMVRWHLAMVLGHLALDWDEPEAACALLTECLEDGSAFVTSWAIVSLCIYAKIYPTQLEMIMRKIVELGSSPSAAVRSKVKNAVLLLANADQPFPKGWVKSEWIKSALIRYAGK